MKEYSKDKYWFNLIIDSLTGNISEESRLELDKWLTLSDYNRAYFIEIRKVWKSMEIIKESERFDDSLAYQNFRKRIKPAKKSIRYKVLLYAAAAVLVFGFFSISYFSLYSRLENKGIAEIVVENGSRSKAVLDDGTIIWLNAGSSIEIDKDFGKKERRIKLYGEAFLNVAKNKKIPFIVQTRAFDIKVHGTSFNVESYNESDNIKVALIEGAIEILPDKSASFMLKPNQMAIYNTALKSASIIDNENADAVAWRQNHLIFKDEKFEKIIGDLERKFNVTIINKTNLKNHFFTGDFVKDESLEQILKVMSLNGEFKYKIADRQVELCQ